MANSTCSISGCESKSFTKGLCTKHYQRVRTHGDPHAVHPKAKLREQKDKDRKAAWLEKLSKAVVRQDHTCQGCGVKFKPKNADRIKFCSRECFSSNQPKRFKRLGLCRVSFRDCVDCGQKFSVRGQKIRCEPCNSLPEVSTCRFCNKPYERSEAYQRFCSQDCREQSHTTSNRKARRKRRKEYGKHWRKRCRVLGLPYEPVVSTVIFDRDKWRCQICGDKTPERLRGTQNPRAPTLDHRIPLSRGGGHLYSNLQCACRQCNTKKGNRVVIGQLPLFNNPKEISIG